MRAGLLFVMAAGSLACNHLTNDLGQSDEDILSINIPSQQPAADLGVLVQLGVYSGSSGQLHIDIEAGKANAGSGADTTLCLDVSGGKSQEFVLNVSPTNGSALMRVSLLSIVPDTGKGCSGEVRKTTEAIVQRPATNPPGDGGMP